MPRFPAPMACVGRIFIMHPCFVFYGIILNTVMVLYLTGTTQLHRCSMDYLAYANAQTSISNWQTKLMLRGSLSINTFYIGTPHCVSGGKSNQGNGKTMLLHDCVTSMSPFEVI